MLVRQCRDDTKQQCAVKDLGIGQDLLQVLSVAKKTHQLERVNCCVSTIEYRIYFWKVEVFF
ncbi:hypothetical protein GN244_ATG05780 [Phytophthora infestans]|uniref:Uncharacterized protein n=1 Tax=Phytophthora infestans TaxID=4787 RepID=A0A833TFD5_PHYIN|nr:hypothetical protein GN244_ATG05780 [Phytophthora infestans]